MDREQCITLMSFLESVPDPRKARGKRYEWRVLLAILCAGLLSGQETVWGIAHWAVLHAGEVIELLQISRKQVPSVSTFYRALRAVSIELLEGQIKDLGTALDGDDRVSGCVQSQDGEVLRGQAIDGKELRGARSHGEEVHLVSLVRHGSGIVLGQERVAEKTNEIKAVPDLIAGRDLRGTVTTMDALLTQRQIAQQIVVQQGDYLMVVKQNQRQLWEAIDLLFQSPPLSEASDHYRTYTYHCKEHGRLETRTLERSAALSNYLDWPGVQQVMRRTYRSMQMKTGKVSEAVTYGITSLNSKRAAPKQIEQLWRGHWTIENRDHYVRDQTLGEDRCQLHTGNAAQALAALRNGVVSTLRYQGWESIAAALRHYGASVKNALSLIGATAT